MIEEYLGKFTYELVEASNGYVFFVPDAIWIVKAILLIVCAYMFLRVLGSFLNRGFRL